MGSDEEQAALQRELGRVGARVGGGWGARFAARFLADDVHEIDVEVNLPVAESEAMLRRVLADLQDPDVPAESGTDLRVVIGAGYFNLNPAVVTVTVEPADSPGTSTVHIRGVAKEGLIKQHSGRTAANRVAAALAQYRPGG
jgi:hypothetical protein